MTMLSKICVVPGLMFGKKDSTSSAIPIKKIVIEAAIKIKKAIYFLNLFLKFIISLNFLIKSLVPSSSKDNKKDKNSFRYLLRIFFTSALFFFAIFKDLFQDYLNIFLSGSPLK